MLEELWGYEPEDAFCKIFKRESKTRGVEDILALSKKDILELSHRDNSTSQPIHSTMVDASKVRMLHFYHNYLHEYELFPEDGSFRFTSISLEDCEIFRKHPDQTTRASQDSDIRTPVPKSLSSSNQTSTPAQAFKKSIKRDATLFPTFKDGKYWDNWRRSSLAIARAQDAEDVLNHNCAPLNDLDNDLFTEK